MSASTAIGDVTTTLVELLKNGQDDIDPFEVTQKSPADPTFEGDSNPKVNLYLFRIEENPFARNQDWQAVGNDILHKVPLSLNLFYVLTPYATDQHIGHRVLGEAMRIIYDNSIVEPTSLSGSLANSAEPLKVDLCSFNLEELTRVWNAFNVTYRLSVCYQVRIVFIDSTIERKIVRVTEKQNQHETKEA